MSSLQLVGTRAWTGTAESALPESVSWDERLTRFMNIGCALAALVFFIPIMAAIALAILLCDPGPVLFGHARIGRHGRTFRCWKFRTMTSNAEHVLARHLDADADARREWQSTRKLRRDPRVTRIGRLLRRSSLDELPQLLNVLRGEMSIVGPRPITDAEAGRYRRYFVHYCAVRPGITGLWQVTGRSNTSYRRRVATDVAYARSRGLAMDIRIMLLTIPSVLRGDGSC